MHLRERNSSLQHGPSPESAVGVNPVAEDCPTCALMRGILLGKGVSLGTAQEVAYSAPVRRVDRKGRRGATAANKRLGRALKKVNKRAKKKDGSFRKGWNRSKVFKMAHKEARKK